MNGSTFQDDLVYEWVRFFKGQVYGVGFEILVRTPVPQLSPSYPLPHSHPPSTPR